MFLVALIVLLDHDDLTLACPTAERRCAKTYLLTSVPTLENNAIMCEPHATRMIRTQPYRACRS